jgi:hypothetical protein
MKVSYVKWRLYYTTSIECCQVSSLFQQNTPSSSIVPTWSNIIHHPHLHALFCLHFCNSRSDACFEVECFDITRFICTELTCRICIGHLLAANGVRYTASYVCWLNIYLAVFYINLYILTQMLFLFAQFRLCAVCTCLHLVSVTYKKAHRLVRSLYLLFSVTVMRNGRRAQNI